MRGRGGGGGFVGRCLGRRARAGVAPYNMSGARSEGAYRRHGHYGADITKKVMSAAAGPSNIAMGRSTHLPVDTKRIGRGPELRSAFSWPGTPCR
jgi:hypothetical protein